MTGKVRELFLTGVLIVLGILCFLPGSFRAGAKAC